MQQGTDKLPICEGCDNFRAENGSVSWGCDAPVGFKCDGIACVRCRYAGSGCVHLAACRRAYDAGIAAEKQRQIQYVEQMTEIPHDGDLMR